MNWTIVIITVLALYAVVSTFFAIRFGITILKLQDAVESSLDVIDTNYRSVGSILERPLFYDSPEVRQVLNDISEVRNSIFLIADSFSGNFNQEIQEIQEIQEDLYEG